MSYSHSLGRSYIQQDYRQVKLFFLFKYIYEQNKLFSLSL